MNCFIKDIIIFNIIILKEGKDRHTERTIEINFYCSFEKERSKLEIINPYKCLDW